MIYSGHFLFIFVYITIIYYLYIMQVIRIKKKTPNKISLASTLFSVYCQLSDIDISKTETMILAYFAVYGLKKSTKDLIIKSQILKSYNALENTVSKLRKRGLIDRDKDNTAKLCKELSATIGNRMGMIIDLQNI